MNGVKCIVYNGVLYYSNRLCLYGVSVKAPSYIISASAIWQRKVKAAYAASICRH